MNARTLQRLAGLLVAALVVWVGLGALRRARDTDKRLALPRFDAGAVNEVRIVKGADTLRFLRSQGGWTVNGYAADAPLVNELVAAMGDTSTRSELVAERASSHRQLGLDSAGAWRVSVLQGARTVGDLLIGGQGSGFGTVYARKPGEDAAYHLEGQLGDLVRRKLDEWRNKTVANIPPDSVVAMEVQRGRSRYTLTKGDAGWRLGSVAADSAAVANLLGRFHALVAAGFATRAETDSLRAARPVRSVKLLARGGTPLLVLSVDSTAGGLWARRQGDSVTYRLDSWSVNTRTPPDSTLLKKAAGKTTAK